MALALSSLTAEDVLLGFEDLALGVDDSPVDFDHAFGLQVGVPVVGLFEMIKTVELSLADVLDEDLLANDSASNVMYRSRMIRFLSR